jgi:hypothetical protein
MEDRNGRLFLSPSEEVILGEFLDYLSSHGCSVLVGLRHIEGGYPDLDPRFRDYLVLGPSPESIREGHLYTSESGPPS